MGHPFFEKSPNSLTMINRRNLLKSVSLLGVGSMTSTLSSDWSHSISAGRWQDATIVFQGDSITDAGRDRSQYYPNQSGGMGQGYVRHIVTELMGSVPSANLKIYNRGISGNKVHQLHSRWQDDCIQLRPDILSIMIGVNDFWHTLSGNYKGTVSTYQKDLEELLQWTKRELPEVTLVIGEPFVCLEGSAIDRSAWTGAFEAYQLACRNVAKAFDAIWIPYQSVFDKALQMAPVSYWCPDGVHPSMAGSYLMAQAWLEATRGI